MQGTVQAKLEYGYICYKILDKDVTKTVNELMELGLVQRDTAICLTEEGKKC